MELGLEWLATLGEVKANFGDLTTKLKVQGETTVLKADPKMIKASASIKLIQGALQDQGLGFILECNQVEHSEEQITIPQYVQEVLEAYTSVFQTPQGLPHMRRQDHVIITKPAAQIPNLRPYKYPHYQKEEIEKLVRELLSSGFIQPSTNLYASPIILVKKKLERWRFCVDYRSLNKLAVPDKFPIPVIELLGELGKAVVFSKLDLKSGYRF